VTFEVAKYNPFQHLFREVDLIPNFGDERNGVGISGCGCFADPCSILIEEFLTKNSQYVGQQYRENKGIYPLSTSPQLF